METIDSNESARASLAALNSARNRTEIEGYLPKSPLWYAVPMATGLFATVVFDGGARSVWWLVLAVASLAVLCLHYFRTVRVLPHRSRHTAAVNLVMLAIVWGIFGGLNLLASYASERDSFALLMAFGWLGTTVACAAGLAAINFWRDRALRS